jgi:Tfp pilus assembly protein PilF
MTHPHSLPTSLQVGNRRTITRANINYHLGFSFLTNKDYENAEIAAREALSIFKEHPRSSCLQLPFAYCTMGKARMYQGKIDSETESYFLSALEVLGAVGCLSDRQIVRGALGMFYHLKGSKL